jgi:integrase
MSGEVRHLLNRSGRYFARVVVPVALRKEVGKSELRSPLGPDRRLALRKLPGSVAALLDTIAEARRIVAGRRASTPRRPLSFLEIAHLHYQEILERDSKARDFPELPPSDEVIDERELPHRPFDVPRHTVASLNRWSGPAREKALRRVASGEANDDEVTAVVGVDIDVFRDRGATTAEPGSAEWRKLGRMLANVSLDALQRSFERDQGDYSGRASYPPLTESPPNESNTEAISLNGLLTGYTSELRRTGRGAEAERRWRPCFAALIKFLKHDDAGRLTRPDILRWRDHLLETLAAKTVRDAHISGLKAVLQWAKDSDRLPANFAANVKVRVQRKVRTREIGFTDVEANAVLKACLDYVRPEGSNPQTRESSYTAAAKRWIPWLCAFTGARVSEIAQLRKSDVHVDDKIAHLRITPEAGSTKTDDFRDVPIHPQLIALGFLDFVIAADHGALFFDGKSERTSARHPSKQVAQRLAVWVRSLGVVSKKVSPNHGWRHRMKTIARENELDPRVIDAIQGHAPRTAGEGYGDVSLVAKDKAIRRFPSYLRDVGHKLEAV